MRNFWYRANLMLVLAVCGCSTPNTALPLRTDSSGHVETHRFQQDNYNRRYLLYTPGNLQRFSGPRPLVLVIHGGGGSDRGMMRITKQRWNQLADSHGFYVVYPNAVDRLWDFGEGRVSAKLKRRVDDLTYFRRVLDDVSAEQSIDRSRVFATGISRGGQASYFLACNMPDRVRAIMPVAMPLPDYLEDNCRSGPPVGIALMNGTADPQVPYAGGWITVFRKKREVVLSTGETLALWRKRNGCLNTPTDLPRIDKPGDRTSVSIVEWSKCSGAPVKLFRVENGGHTWPSGVQYLGAWLIGYTSKDIDGAVEGWAFFSQF